MTTIEEKLDQLAEFYSQKDALELRKRELLDEIQVPAEIEAIVKNGMEQIAEADKNFDSVSRASGKILDEELSKVVVPQEYKDALAELDRQRAEITAKMHDVEKEKNAIRSNHAEQLERLLENSLKAKKQIQAEIEAQTCGVYDAINQKKQEIEIEFSGKADDADQNIKKLETEIKAEVKAEGKSVKGKFFHAVYVKGRVTWNTDKMDAWCNDHPFLKEARKEGDPSITLRRI